MDGIDIMGSISLDNINADLFSLPPASDLQSDGTKEKSKQAHHESRIQFCSFYIEFYLLSLLFYPVDTYPFLLILIPNFSLPSESKKSGPIETDSVPQKPCQKKPSVDDITRSLESVRLGDKLKPSSRKIKSIPIIQQKG